jgi:hypothetical protein
MIAPYISPPTGAVSALSLRRLKRVAWTKLSLYVWYKFQVKREYTMHKLTHADLLAAAAAADNEPASAFNPLEQIKLRPDGYYWTDPQGRNDFGPFASLELALADMGDDDEASEPGETLQEAENEIGIADWIDPDTGAPAEGLSHPRLDD